MTRDQLPWYELDDVVRTIGQSWVETRFTTRLLLDLLPALEADPTDDRWEQAAPLLQYVLTAGMRFEHAAHQLFASGESWVDQVTDTIDEMRRTLLAETGWCDARMRILTERAKQMQWPFPYRHVVR